MKRTIYFISILIITISTFSSCSKDKELLYPVIKEQRAFTMGGFAISNNLEQYFNGVKVKDLYRVLNTSDSKIGFDKNDILMELKVKETGATVYEQRFNINDASFTVPKLYFDGKTIQKGYSYPAPVGSEYKANFYFDFPKDSGRIDVVAELMEFYYDFNLENPLVVVKTYPITLASNIEPGKWSDYVTLNKLPEYTKSREDTEFWPNIVIKKTGKPGYMTSNIADENAINLQLPQSWSTNGSTQSIYVGLTKRPNGTTALGPYHDLVQVFQ